MIYQTVSGESIYCDVVFRSCFTSLLLPKTRNSRGNKRSSGAGHSNTTGNPLGSSADPEYYEQARRLFFYSYWLIFFRTGPTKCFGNCVSRFVNGISSTPVSKTNCLYSFTSVCRDALYNARLSSGNLTMETELRISISLLRNCTTVEFHELPRSNSEGQGTTTAHIGQVKLIFCPLSMINLQSRFNIGLKV